MSHKSTPWRVTKSIDSEYLTMWQVMRTVMGRKENGFFKIPKRNSYQHIGPLLANEMICNKLAKLLGLPVAKTQLMRIRGHHGALSIAKPKGKLLRWKEYVIKQERPITNIINYQRLYKTFVFDTWVCNIDRNNKNIIVYRKGKKYDFYLIDHELSLLGAVRYEEKPWHSLYWDNVTRYTKGYKPALFPFVKSYSALKPFVQSIQQIPVKTIHSVVDSVSPTIMSRKDKALTKKILCHRQNCLHDILKRSIR